MILLCHVKNFTRGDILVKYPSPKRKGRSAKVVKNTTLTKAGIVEAIFEKSHDKNKKRADFKEVLEEMIVLMKQAIKRDHTLMISGFGKFEAYDKDARRGRNPQTNEKITLPARKVVVFRLSRKLRAEINGEPLPD